MSFMIAVAVVDLKAGAALDFAVAKALGLQVSVGASAVCRVPTDDNMGTKLFRPSTSWEQGGPLIDQFDIWIAGPLEARRPTQAASVGIDGISAEGASKLESAMKAIVASKFGDAVTVPRFLVEAKS